MPFVTDPTAVVAETGFHKRTGYGGRPLISFGLVGQDTLFSNPPLNQYRVTILARYMRRQAKKINPGILIDDS